MEPVPANSAGASKGRPTPKRRTKSAPPVPAPRTRKEAVAWQKEHAAKAKVAGQRKLTPAEYKQAMRNGDPAVLPRRDQGPVRQLARDYVDSHRMGSNYLLLLFPLMVIGYFYPPLQISTLLLFALFAAEWMYTGYRIRRLAVPSAAIRAGSRSSRWACTPMAGPTSRAGGAGRSPGSRWARRSEFAA